MTHFPTISYHERYIKLIGKIIRILNKVLLPEVSEVLSSLDSS